MLKWVPDSIRDTNKKRLYRTYDTAFFIPLKIHLQVLTPNCTPLHNYSPLSQPLNFVKNPNQYEQTKTIHPNPATPGKQLVQNTTCQNHYQRQQAIHHTLHPAPHAPLSPHP